MPEIEQITRAEAARRLNVSRAAVTLAVQSGRFDENALAGSKLRWPAAKDQWYANRDVRGKGAAEDLDEDEDDQAPGSIAAPAPGSVASTKTEVLKLRGEKLQLELDRERGLLIDRELVTSGLQEAGTLIGADIDALTAYSEKLAAIPAGDVAAMRAALREIAHTTRTSIAGRLETALSGASSDDDDAE